MRVDTVTRTIYVTPDGLEHADLAVAEDHATNLAIEKLSVATVEEYRAFKAGTLNREDPLRLSFMWFANHIARQEDRMDVPRQETEEAPGIGHNGGPAIDHAAEQAFDDLAKQLAGH